MSNDSDKGPRALVVLLAAIGLVLVVCVIAALTALAGVALKTQWPCTLTADSIQAC